MDRVHGWVYLVTGASSGIGRDVSRALAREGAIVYGGARHLPEAYEAGAGAVRPLVLDVTDEASVEAAVARILAEAGRIDGLINCAGSGIAGAMEDCSGEEALAQLDVNTVGPLRTARAVLPHMRKAGRGVIINIGSIGGDFALPFQGLYSMSKAALRKETECLRLELRPYGVQAAVIEPGDLKTGFTAARRLSAATSGSVYEAACRRAVAQMARDEQRGKDPACVTNMVLKLLKKRHLPGVKAVGGIYRVFPFLNRILPSRAVEAILSKMYHVAG